MRILVDRLTAPNADGNRAVYQEIAGTSWESKPTGLATGSTFLEVDTGDVYIYDEASGTWGEL